MFLLHCSKTKLFHDSATSCWQVPQQTLLLLRLMRFDEISPPPPPFIHTAHKYVHMYTFVHTHTRTHTYMYTQTHVRTHTHTHSCTQIHIRTHTHTHACMHTHTHTRKHTHVCTHAHTHTHTHTCMLAHMYAHHTHTHMYDARVSQVGPPSPFGQVQTPEVEQLPPFLHPQDRAPMNEANTRTITTYKCMHTQINELVR